MTETVRLLQGDCLEVMRTLADSSVDAVVTDPPYGLAFMGKKWDYDVPSVEVWAECLRVLKPGGYLLAFAGTRTQHRMAVRIEDAGFEIRDMIAWCYGSGFPKSLNVAAAIAKLAEPKVEPKAEEIEFCQWLRDNSTLETVSQTLGRRFWDCEVQIVNAATKERPVMARRALVPTAAKWQGFKAQHQGTIPPRIEELAKPEPQRAETPGEEWTPGKGNGTTGSGDWQGWGTALKPALEPITVARKPLTGTVAACVLEHGTGALNVDGCRVTCDPADLGDPTRFQAARKGADSWDRQDKGMFDAGRAGGWANGAPSGRWPANLIHDGSDEVLALFPQAQGMRRAVLRRGATTGLAMGANGIYGQMAPMDAEAGYGDTGSAARFFYTAKASASERQGVVHPTVKPLDLMAYLCRLVTPPGGVVLDPFMGSGTTVKAAIGEGFRAIGIERDPAYFSMAEHRMNGAQLGLLL